MNCLTNNCYVLCINVESSNVKLASFAWQKLKLTRPQKTSRKIEITCELFKNFVAVDYDQITTASYQLVKSAIKRVKFFDSSELIIKTMGDKLSYYPKYILEVGDDHPQIKNWQRKAHEI